MGRASQLPIIACPGRTSSALREEASARFQHANRATILVSVSADHVYLYTNSIIAIVIAILFFIALFALDSLICLYLQLAAELGCLRHFPSCFQKPACFLALTLRI